MLSSIWIVSALCALTIAAPTHTYSSESAQPRPEIEALSAYFEALVSKVQDRKGAGAPSCDLNKAVLPVTCEQTLNGTICFKSQN